MKITLGAIQAAQPALKTLLNSVLPIKPAFKLSKLVKQIDAELVTYEEKRTELVKKFGAEDADGNTTVKPENFQPFIVELGELNSIEVDLAYEPVSIDSLGDDVEMKPVDMAVLEAFLS